MCVAHAPPHHTGIQQVTATSSTAAPWQRPLLEQAIARGLAPLPPAVALGKFDALHRVRDGSRVVVWFGVHTHVDGVNAHAAALFCNMYGTSPGSPSLGSSMWRAGHAAMDGVLLGHGTSVGMATALATCCTTRQVCGLCAHVFARFCTHACIHVCTHVQHQFHCSYARTYPVY